MSSIEIVGMQDLDAKIENLQLNATKIVGPAMKAGAKIFQQACKVNVLRMLGKLSEISKKTIGTALQNKNLARTIYNNIEIAPPKKRKRGQVVYNAQISRKANQQLVYISKSGNRSYIPAAIEYGHRLIYFGKDLQRKVTPIPFMRSAYMSHRNMAKQAILAKALAAIEKAALKKSTESND